MPKSSHLIIETPFKFSQFSGYLGYVQCKITNNLKLGCVLYKSGWSPTVQCCVAASKGVLEIFLLYRSYPDGFQDSIT